MNRQFTQKLSLLIIIIIILFPALGFAQATNLSIHVEQAGTLLELVGEDAETVESLRLSGELNEGDIATMRYLLEEKKLTSIDLEKVEIEDEFVRFDGVYQLKSVVLPENMDTIAEFAFGYCGDLESVILPKNLQVIGERAFVSDYMLASIDLPPTLTRVGDSAFEYCQSLTSVFLPKSLGRIETYAMFSNTSITSAVLEEGIIATGKNLFAGCMFLESLSLPKSLKIIDDQAFFGTESLTSVIIPENVDSIGAYGFMSANNLLKIYSKNPVPPFMQGAFPGDPKFFGIVYVPEGSLDAYKSASEWEEFIYIQEEIITSVENEVVADNNSAVGGYGEVAIFLDESARVEIYTLTGVRAFATTFDAGEHILPLKTGIYVVRLNNISHKVIIK